MKLITNSLEERFKEIGSQDESPDPLVIAKFFNPYGGGTWLATEYIPEREVCFGYVHGLCPGGDEWGYFSISELESLNLPFGLRIERDVHFQECRFSSLKLNVSL